MDTNLPQSFSLVCGELCNQLYIKEYNKAKVNSIIDELNAKPYKVELFDATTLVTALCVNVKPEDEFLAAKTSHLINSIITKQNLQFDLSYLAKVVIWYIDCLRKCSDIVLPDILHNLQCILQLSPQLGHKFSNSLIGPQGILMNLIDIEKNQTLSTQSPLQICLIALKCIICCISSEENKTTDETNTVPLEVKEQISSIVVKLLMKGSVKSQDEFLYCKVVIAALRVLTQLYFNDQNVPIPLPEVVGLCRYFILYGLVAQGPKPERLMPAQQSIAAAPVKIQPKGGKKQKIRKQRNNAIESLKKEIPVSDHILMKDVGSFENSSAYKPASMNYLEPQKAKNTWALTSDSDMSDVENNREAKLVALKSRVRQSASNLLLVLAKVTERKDMFGYWWALLPDSPNADNWSSEEGAKKTLAYCAVTDPIANSRASVLSVILALLSGSRIYLSQAESSKKGTKSFIPFSESLGYVITCMHKVLVSILDTERSHAVIIVALKCCAALVQSTPYHKMQEGLISELVRATRKFLVHRDVTLQVGALITMGCVLSIDPKVDELLKAIEKDSKAADKDIPAKAKPVINQSLVTEDCDDFEEGYSDDEMFTDDQLDYLNDDLGEEKNSNFKTWILDICFKNMGFILKGKEMVRVKPAAIPVILESLQVLSAIAFHHTAELLISHLPPLTELLCEMLRHEHQDVVVYSARMISIMGDALQKLEQSEQPPPLNQCVTMWQALLTPLSTVIQCHETSPAKAIVCDCIANIGERSFKELPRRLQMLCCTLLVGSYGDEEANVRAAAVRALAMTVMYRTLREDINFVSDCGEYIIRALSESSLVVRNKGAWALGNLSDALVLNMEDPDTERIDDALLCRLLEVSVKCAVDNDKVKMSATRGLGNFLRLIRENTVLNHPQMKALCETAIERLLDCACKVSNMKVRWNACYAMGNAMKNEYLFTGFSGWQSKVFPKLCALSQDCKNLKVRINAAVALRAPVARAQYGEHFPLVWRGVMAAMENAANVDDFTEYKHKDNLIEQLCVTLAHLCCMLTQSDLNDILDPLVFHYDCAKSLFTQLCHKLPPENASCLKILQAAKYVTVDLTAANDTQSQSLGMLQDIFIWDM
ncbi:hypothetical protein ABMA27_016568 [Loxostege sticticalis]|uniref:HEAT repeat-containing protein 6 n=1 Tax=Loxostege sticticalis TaxID=481309 RepID=A0ABR3I2S3_LOXSC